jgi:peptidoglycan L-alanyl-D-glutamate endopeptidase CwlK
MPSFSKTSKRRLSECDERLQNIFNEVVKHFDCSILCGHRGADEQNAAYASGNSKLRFPRSKHNSMPSKAVDVAFYPIEWDNVEKWYLFSGFVLGVAASMGVKLRWGGDWDSDYDLEDQIFNDFPHFEIL